LLAQWQAWRAKPAQDKKALNSQNRSCLTEAFALKFESMKYDMESKNKKMPRDSDVLAEILAALQRKQDRECQKILDVGSQVRCFKNYTFRQIGICDS